MTQLLVVMAILGCADDGSQCRAVQRVETPFASVDACNAAAPQVLGKLTDLAFPTIMAQCHHERRPMVAEAAPARGGS